MEKPLKIIHLEDLPDDADIVARALKKSGIPHEILQTENREDFIKALDEFNPDIILSDHSLPGMDSHTAIQLVKERGMETPFILVTATVSEEYAVTIIKEGASDYILKDRLQRLPNAIIGAMEKHRAELARRDAVEVLRLSERKYKSLFEANPLPMWMVDRANQDILAVNEAAVRHYGYTREEFLDITVHELSPKEEIEDAMRYIQFGGDDFALRRIWKHLKKDGEVILVELIAHDLQHEARSARLLVANDVTEKLRAEAELVQQKLLQQKLISETSIMVQEQERDEIGKELHDHINQILATANLYLQMGIKKHDGKSELFDKSRNYIMLAIAEIRKLSHNLVAPSLGKITLVEAINELIENIHQTTSLKVKLLAKDFDEKLIDQNLQLMFYRVIQEQISNILKHANADHATINFTALPGEVLLTISDDGQGLDVNKNSNGIGLKNIYNRAGFYEGSSRIISEPGNGCILEVKVPVGNTKSKGRMEKGEKELGIRN